MAGKKKAWAVQEEIKRLKNLGMKDRAIARALGCSRNTVAKYLQPMIPKGPIQNHWTHFLDWSHLIAEFEKGVPTLVLWEELLEDQKISVQYPAFWKQLRRRCPELKKSMHRVFAPGSRVEIDYADGITIVDPLTGEVRTTQFFVGVLCHSRYLFAEFTWTQTSVDFLSSHVRMLEKFGGVPHIVCPDNLKSAVTKTHAYDPVINPAYTRVADYYGFAVVPARVRTPKDKAIVERSIQIFQRWFFWKVRHRTFTSLLELNQCLDKHLEIFHQKKHRIFQKSRAEMFLSEKSFLSALPSNPYEVATHHRATLHTDCHLQFDKNYYSAPFMLRGKIVDVWATATTVEIFFEATRVAFHNRSQTTAKHITDTKHYPPEHQAYAETTPQRLREIAKEIGPEISELIHRLLSGAFPLQFLRRAQGIVSLRKVYEVKQLEEAAKKANVFKQTSYGFLKRLLKNDRTPKPQTPLKRESNPHLRGTELFH